ncbi:hypothetical protein Tco_1386388 [Tanacetum coccineum]
MQALKRNNKNKQNVPGTEGSNEGTSTIPGVPDESTVVSATFNERTSAQPRVPDKDKDITKEKKDEKDGDADDEGDDHVSDKQDDDDEDDKTESDEDDIYNSPVPIFQTASPELTKKPMPNELNKNLRKVLPKFLKIKQEQEPVEEPIVEVIMDDVGDDVARDDNPPQVTSEPKTRKTLNQDCFNATSRFPCIAIVMLAVASISNLPKSASNILEDKLDWNNPKGDRYPFDLFKPLPLQGPLGHRTVAADYFFNNDLEYLKTSHLEVTYTTSITKTNAARY